MKGEIHQTLSEKKRAIIISSGGKIFYEPTLDELSARAERQFFEGAVENLGLTDPFIIPYRTSHGEIDLAVPVAAVIEKMKPVQEYAKTRDWEHGDVLVTNDTTWVIGENGEATNEREAIVNAKDNLSVVINKPSEGNHSAADRLIDLLKANEGNYLFSVGAQAKYDPVKDRNYLSQGYLTVGRINELTPEAEEKIRKNIEENSAGLELGFVLESGMVTPPEIGFVQFRDVFRRTPEGDLAQVPADMKVLDPRDVSAGGLYSHAHGYNGYRGEADIVMGL